MEVTEGFIQHVSARVAAATLASLHNPKHTYANSAQTAGDTVRESIEEYKEIDNAQRPAD